MCQSQSPRSGCVSGHLIRVRAALSVHVLQEIRQTSDFHEHIVNIPLHTRLPLSQSTRAGVSSCMGETSGKKTEKLQREGGWSDASLSRTLLRAVLNVKVVWW